MSPVVLPQTNGSIQPLHPWMRQSVQEFFSEFNWEDHPPEVQELKLSSLQADGVQSLSLKLTVNQFFSSINWEGGSVAAAPVPPAPPSSGRDAFTLDDFSDLF